MASPNSGDCQSFEGGGSGGSFTRRSMRHDKKVLILVDTKPFDSGLVVLTYSPAR